MRNKPILIENARLLFKNFSGAAGKFNAEGIRSFCVELDPETAQILKEDGWNIRYFEPKDEGEVRQPYMSVAVSYRKEPPTIVMISSRGQSLLQEDDIKILDWADMAKVDLTVNPSRWEMNGNKGTKAYLKSLYVTIFEDPLAEKYSNAPNSAESAIGGCGNCDTCDGSCDCGH